MMDFSGNLLGPDSSQPPVPPTSQLATATGYSPVSVAVPGGPTPPPPDLNLQPLAPRSGLPQVLMRGWWLIALGMAAGLGTAYTYCKRTTPIYTDTAKIFLGDVGPHVVDEGQLNPNSGYLQAQVESLKSMSVMERAAADVGARSMRSFAKAKDVPAAMQSVVVVEPDPIAQSILVLNIDTPYPDEGAKVLNGVIKAYTEQAASSRDQSIDGVVGVLDQQLVLAKTEEADALAAVKKFRQDNPTVNVTGTGPSELDTRAAAVQKQINDLQSDQTLARATVDEAEAALASPAATLQFAQTHRPKDVTSGPDAFATTAARLEEANQQLQRDSAVFGSANQRLQTDRTMVDRIKAGLPDAAAARVQAQIQDARNQLKDDADRLADLKQQSATLAKQVDDANGKAADYASLASALQTKQAQRTELEKQVRNLQISKNAGGITVNVVEPARAAIIPVWPVWNRSLAAGGFAGAILGLAGAIVLAGIDGRIRTADEALEELGLPLLGVIPNIRGGNGRGKAVGSERARAVHLQPATPAAEAYRTIRTALYYGLAAGKPRGAVGGPRRVLITSPLPGDGKSTFASNLAIAMAQSGRRVVLVDADLRRPTQLGNHDMQPPTGSLADVFAGRIHLSKLVRATSVDRLHLLACGPAVGPAELLTSPLFGKMLDSLNRACDVVVIDSPPVLPVADARILAVGCDATILVLRSGKSRRRTARAARDNLLSVGASLVGTVINDVPRAAKEYGYGQPYGAVVQHYPVPSVVAPGQAPANGNATVTRRPGDKAPPMPKNGSPEIILNIPAPDAPYANGQVVEPAGK